MSKESGINFEHSAILAWQSLRGDVCPVTGGPLGDLLPNNFLQAQIHAWKQHMSAIPSQSACVQVKKNPGTKRRAKSAAAYIADVKKRKISSDTLKELHEKSLEVVRNLTDRHLEHYARQIERGAYKKRQAYESQSIFRRGATLNIKAL